MDGEYQKTHHTFLIISIDTVVETFCLHREAYCCRVAMILDVPLERLHCFNLERV